MEIESNRIKLRAIEPEDLELLLSLINSQEMEKKTGGWSFPVSNQQQKDWISDQQKNDQNLLRCMIEVKKTCETIGTAILSDIDYKNGSAQVHIKLDPNVQSKGYGTETIMLLETYAFEELRINCIYAEVIEYNTSSIGLFEKLGYSKEGVLRERIFKKGEYHNQIIFSKLKSDRNGNR